MVISLYSKLKGLKIIMVILLTQKLKGLKNYHGHFTHSAKLLVLCTVNEKVAAGVDNKQKV